MNNEIYLAQTEQVHYLMKHLDHYIENSVENVLSDSVEHPEFSAVTTANLIKCYIDVIKTLGYDVPYTDIKSYFFTKAYSLEEYVSFEERRKEESAYYIGKQYL